MAEDSQTDQPALVKVTLGGREFEVPAEVGAAMTAERDRMAGDYGQRLSALQSYEAQLAAERARLEQQNQPVDDGTPHAPDPNDLERDPTKYARENQAWTEYLVASSAQQVENQRHQEAQLAARETARAAEWSKQVTHFYETHADLKEDADIVDAVWRQHFAKIKDMKVEDGFEYLARASKERILRLAERGKTRRAPRIESAAGSPDSRYTEPEPEQPEQFGLGRLLKAKQARMRAASH